MEKLFKAIRDQHEGCDIVDVRFLVNKLKRDDEGHDVSLLDESLAEAVNNAGAPKTQPTV